MASKTTICNMAVSRIRHNFRVANIETDTTETAKLLKQYFEPARDFILEQRDWGFAHVFAALAPTGNQPLAGWSFEYEYPADCVRILSVTDKAGGRIPMRPTYRDSYAYGYGAMQANPFTRMTRPTDELSVLVCDVDAAYAHYTRQIIDTERWPPTFVNCFAWYLGSEIAPALKVDEKITGYATQQYQGAMRIAAASSANEGRPDKTPDSPSIAGR